MLWSDGVLARPRYSQLRHRNLTQPVDLRRQNEVRLGQSVHRVRPGRDLNLAPCQKNVRMMALLLGNHADFIDEGQRGLEIRKLESADEMMSIHDPPGRRIGELLMNVFQLVPFEWRNSAATRNTRFVS